MGFTLDKNQITQNGRVVLGDWVQEDLERVSQALSDISKTYPEAKIVQHGRVVVLRATDQDRVFSAFKSALYLGKYADMFNTDRFLTKMVQSHHSYEPIRGENVLFLFIGVGKPVYDHMVTYTVGRPTRIAGGQRANLPWGVEVPVELKDVQGYVERNMRRVEDVINLTGKGAEKPDVREQLQAARSELPVGYIMPPFLMEFSEEALIKNVLRQRLWEQGAQGATVDIVNDMWKCLLQIDPEKWEFLEDFHGQDTIRWEKVMRTLRDKGYKADDLMETLVGEENMHYHYMNQVEYICVPTDISLYDLLVKVYGKLPPTMWDKLK